MSEANNISAMLGLYWFDRPDACAWLAEAGAGAGWRECERGDWLALACERARQPINVLPMVLEAAVALVRPLGDVGHEDVGVAVQAAADASELDRLEVALARGWRGACGTAGATVPFSVRAYRVGEACRMALHAVRMARANLWARALEGAASAQALVSIDESGTWFAALQRAAESIRAQVVV